MKTYSLAKKTLLNGFSQSVSNYSFLETIQRCDFGEKYSLRVEATHT